MRSFNRDSNLGSSAYRADALAIELSKWPGLKTATKTFIKLLSPYDYYTIAFAHNSVIV